ncbi:MAG TPA: hypothetical protein VHE59_16805 [Mucilaginibacter sp.]|nr:hypothetical protein [Mucilaginibacter sp.]
MTRQQEIISLKENIVKIGFAGKEQLVDKLIDLEGMKAMSFFNEVFMIDPYQQDESSKELNNIAGYGVRQLLKLQAVLSMSDFKFCPCCMSDLMEHELLDIYMQGLRCSSDHYFHVDIDYAKSNDINVKSEKEYPLDIAKDWLTDKNLRNNLQNQLADILRKYITIKSSPDLTEQPNETFRYCPICANELTKFKQDDVWVEGLKCKNEHVFYSRNGLNYNGTQLTPDISEQNFKSLLDSYVQDQDIHVPGQILKLLNDIKQEIQ